MENIVAAKMAGARKQVRHVMASSSPSYAVASLGMQAVCGFSAPIGQNH
ncbi:hypothetical protein EKH55_2624 [Sinorhizobium alkalisoli]|nr:hypothetical protein EKH55_2624 [Sinorhizobium alkalisoli]